MASGATVRAGQRQHSVPAAAPAPGPGQHLRLGLRRQQRSGRCSGRCSYHCGCAPAGPKWWACPLRVARGPSRGVLGAPGPSGRDLAGVSAQKRNRLGFLHLEAPGSPCPAPPGKAYLSPQPPPTPRRHLRLGLRPAPALGANAPGRCSYHCGCAPAGPKWWACPLRVPRGGI